MLKLEITVLDGTQNALVEGIRFEQPTTEDKSI